MTKSIKDMTNEELYIKYGEHVRKHCRIAQSKHRWALTLDEATQVGWLGLIKMMRNYQPLDGSTEADFLALSGVRVGGAIRDEVRNLCGRKVVNGKPHYSMRWLEIPLEDILIDENRGIPTALHFIDSELPEVPIEKLIDTLSDQQKEAILGLYKYEKTLMEVALYLGVTESRVSQIHQQALAKLRHQHSREERYAA